MKMSSLQLFAAGLLTITLRSLFALTYGHTAIAFHASERGKVMHLISLNGMFERGRTPTHANARWLT